MPSVERSLQWRVGDGDVGWRPGTRSPPRSPFFLPHPPLPSGGDWGRGPGALARGPEPRALGAGPEVAEVAKETGEDDQMDTDMVADQAEGAGEKGEEEKAAAAEDQESDKGVARGCPAPPSSLPPPGDPPVLGDVAEGDGSSLVRTNQVNGPQPLHGQTKAAGAQGSGPPSGAPGPTPQSREPPGAEAPGVNVLPTQSKTPSAVARVLEINGRRLDLRKNDTVFVRDRAEEKWMEGVISWVNRNGPFVKPLKWPEAYHFVYVLSKLEYEALHGGGGEPMEEDGEDGGVKSLGLVAGMEQAHETQAAICDRK